MMRAVVSDSLGDFAAVYDADVEMISVSRSGSSAALVDAAQALAQSPGLAEKWSQAANDAVTPLEKLAKHLSADAAAVVAEEITVAADMLGYLLDCSEVGIRLGALTRPMCPRFHVDRVPCRLLMTLAGTGTEWIANPDVDFDLFADRSSTCKPLKTGCHAHVVDTGAWALLKGGLWSEGFDGVVHRSPASNDPRLLISVDPLFD